ncbi:iojap-like ribosome-associated protein [Synechococcus sp. PCC 7502]|uniref:ribosome silencing factor n=1 Tax=Synechococcus sp. PCC 7502 TaxID=1173263 RepID=UPI00029F9EA6|nr:ribosome silencing factor [Synechococcus sp. PCC 7502]AFY72458.1 iojap-like ribosome-associated protein [Synechococcus sp. PCC 7502]
MTSNPTQDFTYKMTVMAALAADDRKAEDILIIAIGEVSVLADYFIIATGRSKAQVRAIANGIKTKISEELQREPIRMAGESDAGWILQDYGDVIVHIMMPTEREFYGLEAFWGHAPKFTLDQIGLAAIS